MLVPLSILCRNHHANTDILESLRPPLSSDELHGLAISCKLEWDDELGDPLPVLLV
jgi:hypothetical protein